MRTIRLLFVLIFSGYSIVSLAQETHQEPKTLAIGQSAPDFKLKADPTEEIQILVKMLLNP